MKVSKHFHIFSLVSLFIICCLIMFSMAENATVAAAQPKAREQGQLTVSATTTISITTTGFEPSQIDFNLGDLE